MLEWLESTQFSFWIRTNPFGWPAALTAHVLGTALAAGLMFIIGLRLLGVFKLIPYSTLKRMFALLWAAFALEFVSGVALWMSRPAQYMADTAFLLKIVLLVAGIVLGLRVYRLIAREGGTGEQNPDRTAPATGLAAATLLVWCCIIVASRLTGYLASV